MKRSRNSSTASKVNDFASITSHPCVSWLKTQIPRRQLRLTSKAHGPSPLAGRGRGVSFMIDSPISALQHTRGSSQRNMTLSKRKQPMTHRAAPIALGLLIKVTEPRGREGPHLSFKIYHLKSFQTGIKGYNKDNKDNVIPS